MVRKQEIFHTKWIQSIQHWTHKPETDLLLEIHTHIYGIDDDMGCYLGIDKILIGSNNKNKKEVKKRSI